MITYTHICMNCGPERTDGVGVTGAPTTMIDGKCERCGSEAIAPMPAADDRAEDSAARLAALEAFHEEIVREKNRVIVLLRLREKDFAEALAGYRNAHKKCVVGGKRCARCRRADELLESMSSVSARR